MLTKTQAMTVRELHHATLSQGQGQCYRVRRNGRTQTWKTRPGDFRLPVIHGYHGPYATVTQDTASEWHPADYCPRCTVITEGNDTDGHIAATVSR